MSRRLYLFFPLPKKANPKKNNADPSGFKNNKKVCNELSIFKLNSVNCEIYVFIQRNSTASKKKPKKLVKIF